MIYFDILYPSVYVTLFYTIFPFIIGCIIAACITAMRVIINIDIKLLIYIIRGTPLVVQLYFCKYCLPFNLLGWQAGLLAFSINSAIHLVEIIRGAIDSIDRGQWEAAQVLGISKYRTLLNIILPQAITVGLPSLINEMSALLKESAIVSMIGETDVMRKSYLIASYKFQYTVPILIAGSIYLIIFFILERIALFFSRRCKIVKNY